MRAYPRRRKAEVLWYGFMTKEPGSRFLNVQCSVENSEILAKGEQWKSEKAMLKEFRPEEFQMHLASGRILWRNGRMEPWSRRSSCVTSPAPHRARGAVL